MRSSLLHLVNRLHPAPRLLQKFFPALLLLLSFSGQTCAQNPPQKTPQQKYWIVFDAEAG
jgi:hypothetical protein